MLSWSWPDGGTEPEDVRTQTFVPCCCWDVSELIKCPADADRRRPKGLVRSNKGAATGREGKIAARPRCHMDLKHLMGRPWWDQAWQDDITQEDL